MPRIDLEKDVELGDFRIEKRLASGGMGIVYQARQISLNRPVALKILGNALTGSAAIARFRREAQAAPQLNHPGIAQIYFVGQTDQVCYMAMELIDGMPLQAVIARLAQSTEPDANIDQVVALPPMSESHQKVTRFDIPEELPTAALEATPAGDGNDSDLSEAARHVIASESHIRRCCEIVRDAAHILDYAHQRGVVHRDIKPGNLMLDNEGKVHVIDFGIARFFEDVTLTQSGQLVGTPMYMSPEQITGRCEPDPRTDIYALGLVLYELLTLRPPLQAPSREELLRRSVVKPLPPVRRLNTAIPKPLEAVVHKATAKDGDERYASGATFAGDIGHFLNGMPVTAPPYRYSADGTEIAASRPSYIFWLSAILFGPGILVGCMTPFTLIRKALAHEWTPAMLTNCIELVVCGVMVVASHGIMGARTWARRIGLAVAIVLVLGSICGLYDWTVDFWKRPGDPMTVTAIGLPVLIGLAGLLIWRGLTARTAREWFAFAARVRAEESGTPKKS